MKTLFLLTLNILFFMSTHAQVNFLIKYKVKSIKSNDKTIKKDSYDILTKNLSKNFDEFNYSLLVNEYESMYKLDEMMTIDNARSKRMTSIILGKDLIYINIKDSIYLKQTEFAGDLHLVKVNFPENEWFITKENKQILSHTCFKAVLKKSNILNEKIKVVGWFTKDISMPFGPKGYYGLPGTILELQEGNISYYATEIKSKYKQTINKPKKGISITEEELEKKAEDAAVKMFGVKREN